MRPFVYRLACELGINGWVLNAGDGVHVQARGANEAVAAFVARLASDAPAAARVERVDVEELATGAGVIGGSGEAVPGAGFRIVASEGSAAKTTLVSPDIATCPDCLRELFSPSDRRYHYPFINCTNCGPRFTIIRALPYDRATTSMAAFGMCPSCAAEYADPGDRRFHAQPDACFECGPCLSWRERGDAEALAGHDLAASDGIIARCAELLAQGGIVAVKGLGGFHLACDAGNEHAVRELRRRKRRSNKPLAIMVHGLAAAEVLCRVSDVERELLKGSVRPIVLLQRNDAASEPSGNAPQLAPSVAYDLPELGVMLPYTPLQQLLLAACEERGMGALVMTSGNISEEPIETDDVQAWEKLVLGGLADALLGNDRAILSRFDDSVVRVVDGAPMPVRRARGYAPQPLTLPATGQSCAVPSIFAAGPEQKATFAFTREEADGTAACFVGQHIGDVENGATFDAWNATRTHFEQLFDLKPAALACDLHPSYLPSQWARVEAQRTGMPLVEVQHHHAHIASVIAEAAAEGRIGAREKVIGLAFDGTGAGGTYNAQGKLVADGTIWGGEFLVADLRGFERIAHLPSWHLPGGAASVKDARRNAYALLHEFGLLEHPGSQALVGSLAEQERGVTRTMIERGINSPRTTSMGRLFDAMAAILGICPSASYEGEPAIRLEAAAWRAIAANYGSAEAFFAIVRQKVCETARFAKPSPCHAANTELLNAVSSLIEGLLSRNIAQNSKNAPLEEQNPGCGETGSCKSGNLTQHPEINCKKLPKAPEKGSACTPPMPETPAESKPDVLALQFHQGIAQAAIAATQQIREQTGIATVALSGGVFMNRLLLTLIKQGLEQLGYIVLVPHTIPVNDGCIAYGQAAVARTRLGGTYE